ncbi:MAG: hypothetical protein ACREDY_12745 [Bradyrhizobium sp.]
MSVKSARIALALSLAVFPVPLASAQGASDEGQKPPVEQPKPDEQKPPEQPKCVTSKTDWKQHGKAVTFVIELQNSCEVRLKCIVEAYVVGSRGPAQGQGTLILSPKSKGNGAIKSFALKVKSMGGTANVSHRCKKI